MYKVVFFDIDGTLLNWQGELSPQTGQAVQRMKENGIIPVIASARPPFNIHYLVDRLGISSYIAFNGGLAVHHNEIVYQSPIDKPTVRQIQEAAHKQGDSIILARQDGFEIKSENPKHIVTEYLRRWDVAKECTSTFEDDILQLELFCSRDSIEEYVTPFHLDFYPWGSRDDAFNVVNSGISKAYGIQRMLNALGLHASEAVAFGDGINDIEMLKTVGMGVAMGNAVEELKPTADFITKHVDEEGISYGLRHLGLI